MHTFTARFVDGLRPDIRIVVAMQRPPNLDTAYSLALLQEEVAEPMKKYEYPQHGAVQGYKPNFRTTMALPRPQQPDKVLNQGSARELATSTTSEKLLELCPHYQFLSMACRFLNASFRSASLTPLPSCGSKLSFSGQACRQHLLHGKTLKLFVSAFHMHQLGGKLVLVREGMSAALPQHMLYTVARSATSSWSVSTTPPTLRTAHMGQGKVFGLKGPTCTPRAQNGCNQLSREDVSESLK
jgi:hypothetical protein